MSFVLSFFLFLHPIELGIQSRLRAIRPLIDTPSRRSFFFLLDTASPRSVHLQFAAAASPPPSGVVGAAFFPSVILTEAQPFVLNHSSTPTYASPLLLLQPNDPTFTKFLIYHHDHYPSTVLQPLTPPSATR